jgi:DNA-binding transcriptional LysR family regulator
VELRHLRYFVAVAEELHFARAAARLGIEQPPLSRQIKDLERELGTELLERTTRSTRLTFAGEVFLRDARAILANVSIASQSVREAVKGRSGRLCMSIYDGFVASDRVVKLLANIRGLVPELELRVLDLPGPNQVEGLHDRQLDLVLSLSEEPGQGLTAHRVWSEPIGVALSVSHPLAKQLRVDIKAIQSETLIVGHPEYGPGCYRQIMSVFKSAGISPRVCEYVLQRGTALALVSAGFGVAITVMAGGEEPIDGVVLRPLEAPTRELTVYAVSRSEDASPCLQLVLDLARDLA